MLQYVHETFNVATYTAIIQASFVRLGWDILNMHTLSETYDPECIFNIHNSCLFRPVVDKWN